MICGVIGCGRYKNGDANKHYLETDHPFSLDLDTFSIWNYKSDCFSHKLAGKEFLQMEMIENNSV